MKLHIPEHGDVLILTKEWTFDLYYEHRNASMLSYFGNIEFNWRDKVSPIKVTLPTGTELKVDRIYIRQGAKNFSSVTFRFKIQEGKKTKSLRFWAKLNDVNNIEASINLATDTIISIVWGYHHPMSAHSVHQKTNSFSKELPGHSCVWIDCMINNVLAYRCEQVVEKYVLDTVFEQQPATILSFSVSAKSFIGSYTPIIKYHLYDKDSKRLGIEATTFSTIKKKVKELVEKEFSAEIDAKNVEMRKKTGRNK